MLFTSSSVALAVSAMFGSALAESGYYFNPNDTALAVRTQWCVQQEAACDLLCLDQKSGSQYSNGCDPATLDFACVCGDGTIPNATEYSQTIPYFICQNEVDNCVSNCNAVSSCVTACRDNKPCGASNPTRVNTTSTTGTATNVPTGTGTNTAGSGDQVYTGLGVAATTTGANGAAATGSDVAIATSSLGQSSGAITNALAFGEVYGIAVMVLSMLCSAYVFLQ